jgi:hypothetical protein
MMHVEKSLAMLALGAVSYVYCLMDLLVEDVYFWMVLYCVLHSGVF